MTVIKRTEGSDPDFQCLASRLTEFLAVLNGEQDAFYAPHNLSDSIPTVVVAYLNGEAVACGALREKGPGVVEIKRMFVDPEHRGKGIGRVVLDELEKWALELNYRISVLETSKRLMPAVSLYARAGYRVIANFAPYEGIEDSVCMEKAL